MSDPSFSLSFAKLERRHGTQRYARLLQAERRRRRLVRRDRQRRRQRHRHRLVRLPVGWALGTNWSASGSGATRTYSFTATATSNGTQSPTTTNSAGRTASASFDLTADSNAPARGGALSVNGTAASGAGTSSYDTDGDFTIGTRTDYTEAQSSTESGLASSTLVWTSAGYTSPNVCAAFGSPVTVVGSPAQSLTTGCYRYTLTGYRQRRQHRLDRDDRQGGHVGAWEPLADAGKRDGRRLLLWLGHPTLLQAERGERQLRRYGKRV